MYRAGGGIFSNVLGAKVSSESSWVRGLLGEGDDEDVGCCRCGMQEVRGAGD